MDLADLFDRHAAIAAAWSDDVRRSYQAFTDRIARDEPLTVTLGKGGLSYYAAAGPPPGATVFVAHFNAAPRAGQTDRGFADFRRDTLASLIDVEALLAELRAALAPETRVTAGKVWCGLHFPIEHAPRVADALRDLLVARLD
ncbi:MAG TPA: hypothetical protein VGE07_19575 [Herpetosiphonaceae bacterium]